MKTLPNPRTPVRFSSAHPSAGSAGSQPAVAGRGEPGFTLVEVAIAIGVIGFALVAIIGILPTGLEVQRDNRTETIVNQDGTFWLEAIRNGSRGLDELPRYVDRIEITNSLTGMVRTYSTFASGAEIIGLLTTQAAITNEEARAYVWAVSGSAAEKEPNAANRELSFKYRMTIHIEQGTNFAVPFSALSTNFVPMYADPLETLYHLRLTFAYPLAADDRKATTRRQSYHAMVNRNVETRVVGGISYYFFTD